MTTKLSEIISVLESGSRPKGGVKENREGIPSLGGEHLSNEGGFNFSKTKMITHEFYSKMKRGKIERGDILIVKDGATTGKVAIVREDFPFKEAAINEHLFRIRVDPDKATQGYIFRYLQSPLGQLQILSSFRGAAIGGINTSFVNRVSLDLPSVDEQIRIAAILDKADEIKQGAQEIQATQEFMIQSTFVEMFGEPYLNPNNYSFTDVDSVCRLVTDGEHNTPVRIDAGIKLLSARNIQNGFIDLEKKCDYISAEEYERISKRCYPEINDVLISCSGTVGRVSAIRIDEPFSLVRSVLLLKPDFDKINSTYLEIFLRTSYSKHQISKRVRTSAQANLFIGRAKTLPVMLPPLEIQQKFEKIVLNFLLLYESLAGGVKMSDLLIDSSVQSLIMQRY